MMSLGMSLRLIPNLPSQFIAFFYLGLGPMLIIYAIKFCKSCKKKTTFTENNLITTKNKTNMKRKTLVSLYFNLTYERFVCL